MLRPSGLNKNAIDNTLVGGGCHSITAVDVRRFWERVYGEVTGEPKLLIPQVTCCGWSLCIPLSFTNAPMNWLDTAESNRENGQSVHHHEFTSLFVQWAAERLPHASPSLVETIRKHDYSRTFKHMQMAHRFSLYFRSRTSSLARRYCTLSPGDALVTEAVCR